MIITARARHSPDVPQRSSEGISHQPHPTTTTAAVMKMNDAARGPSGEPDSGGLRKLPDRGGTGGTASMAKSAVLLWNKIGGLDLNKTKFEDDDGDQLLTK